MTYNIIRKVDIDYGDHGFAYQQTLMHGIKTVKRAEYLLRKHSTSKMFVNGLKKEFADRNAKGMHEIYIITDENGEQASENYWERKIYTSEKSLFDD